MINTYLFGHAEGLGEHAEAASFWLFDNACHGLAHLLLDEDVLDAEREAAQLQEAREQAAETAEQLASDRAAVQLVAAVDQTERGRTVVRLVEHTAEQVAAAY